MSSCAYGLLCNSSFPVWNGDKGPGHFFDEVLGPLPTTAYCTQWAGSRLLAATAFHLLPEMVAAFWADLSVYGGGHSARCRRQRGPSVTVLHGNRWGSMCWNLDRRVLHLPSASSPAVGPPCTYGRPIARSWLFCATAEHCCLFGGLHQPPWATSPPSTALGLLQPASIPAREPGESGAQNPG